LDPTLGEGNGKIMVRGGLRWGTFKGQGDRKGDFRRQKKAVHPPVAEGRKKKNQKIQKGRPDPRKRGGKKKEPLPLNKEANNWEIHMTMG